MIELVYVSTDPDFMLAQPHVNSWEGCYAIVDTKTTHLVRAVNSEHKIRWLPYFSVIFTDLETAKRTKERLESFLKSYLKDELGLYSARALSREIALIDSYLEAVKNEIR